MEFGKLPSLAGVDFSLPPDLPENLDFLKNLGASHSKPTIYLGATGYAMKDWVGKWYPPGTKSTEFLRQYGLQFNTIEHNTTHYAIPNLVTVERWKNEVPADFRYCPKLPQTISHASNLGLRSAQLREFCQNISALEEKLGCCFMQLPPHFSIQNWRILDAFLDDFPREIPLAIEVRHESFFEKTAAADAFFQLLADAKTTVVITDVAGRRDVCHGRLTSEKTMVRFVGNDLHPTDFQRIEWWAERLKLWFGAGLREAYFFTHEPDNLLAPDLAKFAGEVFSEKMPEVLVRFPKPISMVVQGSLF